MVSKGVSAYTAPIIDPPYLHVAKGQIKFDRRFAWDKKLTPVDYA